MKSRTGTIFALLTLAVLTARLTLAADMANPPRLLVLPWLVIDRGTNRECTQDERAPIPAKGEAQRLALAAQAALDNEMHDHRMFEMVPRREWAPLLASYGSGQVYRPGPGCAVCNPVRQLLQYDPALLTTLAQGARADYVWLGVAVLPLTSERDPARGDACCRAALGTGRDAVFARTSALLVRVRDGALMWQQDTRRLEREVPTRAGRIRRTPGMRRQIAVKSTAHELGAAFRGDHRKGGL